MKPQKSTLLIVLFGLLLTVCAVALAQTSSQSAGQGTDKKQSEASCCTDSCCCKGDSCPMKGEGARTTDATAKDSCCCAGDSCEMKKSDSMKNHADHSGCCCCSGDSCDMKAKEKMENHSSTDGCCCDMKNKHNKQNMKAKQKAA